jgi:restriction endonuclease S subunit
LKVKNITRNGDIDYADTEFVQDVPETKILLKGDIVSPFIGEAVRQCKFAIFDRDDEAFTVDNNTGVIRVDAGKANSRYVAEVLNSSVGKIQLEQLIGGGGVPFLGAANATKLQIPLPPIKTQEKIADKIISFREQMRTLRAQAAEVLEAAQQQVEQMILA